MQEDYRSFAETFKRVNQSLQSLTCTMKRASKLAKRAAPILATAERGRRKANERQRVDDILLHVAPSIDHQATPRSRRLRKKAAKAIAERHPELTERTLRSIEMARFNGQLARYREELSAMVSELKSEAS